MKTAKLLNYARDTWFEATATSPIVSAVSGDVVAETGSQGLDFRAMLDRSVASLPIGV